MSKRCLFKAGPGWAFALALIGSVLVSWGATKIGHAISPVESLSGYFIAFAYGIVLVASAPLVLVIARIDKLQTKQMQDRREPSDEK